MAGEVYRSLCTFEGNAEILAEDGDAVWQLTTLHRRPLPFWACTYGLLRDPGCAITGTGGREFPTVTRQRLLPLPRFVMTDGNEIVCTIRQRSLLLNTYSLEFVGGATWVFHMPLFTVHFQGVSDQGGMIRVREWEKRVWDILIEADHDNSLLVCALAFIHRERLRFG